MHLEPIPSLGAVTGCTGVALWAPILNAVACLEPVIRLLTLFRVLLTPKWPDGSPCNLVNMSFTLPLGELSGLFWNGRWTYVCGDCGWWCLSFLAFPVSTSSRMGPTSWSFSCSILRVTGSEPAKAAATIQVAHTCLTSPHAMTL
jgi:hypothetical protein